MQKFLRGQVWFYKDKSISYNNNSVQHGSRPVIIVSNDVGNKASPVLTVVPCTSQSKNKLPTHFIFEMEGITNTALCEQVFTVGKIDLVEFKGVLSNYELYHLNEALAAAVGLNEILADKSIKDGDNSYVNVVKTYEIKPDLRTAKANSTKAQTDISAKHLFRSDELKKEIIKEYNKLNKLDSKSVDIFLTEYNFNSLKVADNSVRRWVKKIL